MPNKRPRFHPPLAIPTRRENYRDCSRDVSHPPVMIITRMME